MTIWRSARTAICVTALAFGVAGCQTDPLASIDSTVTGAADTHHLAVRLVHEAARHNGQDGWYLKVTQDDRAVCYQIDLHNGRGLQDLNRFRQPGLYAYLVDTLGSPLSEHVAGPYRGGAHIEDGDRFIRLFQPGAFENQRNVDRLVAGITRLTAEHGRCFQGL